MKRKRVELNAEQQGLNRPFAQISLPSPPAGLEVGATEAASAPAPAPAAIRGRVVLRRETAHRGGKAVVIVHDFDTRIKTSEIEELGRRLRARCGCGGTVRDREIELQGEQVSKAREVLEREGYRVGGVR